MKHITVQSFICASVDRFMPTNGTSKRTTAMADRNLNKHM